MIKFLLRKEIPNYIIADYCNISQRIVTEIKNDKTYTQVDLNDQIFNELPEEFKQNGHNQNLTHEPLRNEDHEKELILSALSQTSNNKSKAAQILGIDRKTLYNKIKYYTSVH